MPARKANAKTEQPSAKNFGKKDGAPAGAPAPAIWRGRCGRLKWPIRHENRGEKSWHRARVGGSLDSKSDFDRLIRRLDEHDSIAAEEIYRGYAARLITLAHSRLNQRLRARVDPDDIVHSVFRSFFTRHANGEFELRDWTSLWSLLSRITICKCRRQAAKNYSAKRDVRRERPPPTENEGYAWLVDREPAVEEVVILEETIRQLMAQLDKKRQQIVALKLQNFTNREISEATKSSERTVYRVLAQVRNWLSRVESEAV